MLYRYAVEEKKRNKMKTFKEYLDDKVSDSSSGKTPSEASHDAFVAAMEAFERILSSEEHAKHAINFLNKMKEAMPELKTILNKYKLHMFKWSAEKPDFKNVNNQGLASLDVASPGSSAGDLGKGDNVVVPNVADGYEQN